MPAITPVTYDRFKSRLWKPPADYSFAAKDTIALISAEELHLVTQSLPTAFIEMNGAFTYVALVGLAPGKNLFVAPNGGWIGRHIPLSYRGYPFSLSQVEGDSHALCIDEESGLIAVAEPDTESPQYEKFFASENKPSEKVTQVLEFLGKVKAGVQAIGELCTQLKEAELIVPWEIKIKSATSSLDSSRKESGSEAADNPKLTALEGLFRIDEGRLQQIETDVLDRLNKSSALKLAYCQLITTSHLVALGQLASSSSLEVQDKSLFEESALADSLNFDNI